ncbi:hypothetical protein AAE02nite_03310 [Adhaeribacter aerolatus]|uniref:Secretion system C-terminal sorting domain-containing protein n=1 Tax=Adhaeribacter aerolatus TaxID=670289 RepID=A0A512ASW6_9BACT|nr:T9SS type A sorting domain-containing protein [Adhaeribacter aerolatus]GEO02667.1 hypothetical protein AAE02nite_03310 [Adhaeribacter aerolatus]
MSKRIITFFMGVLTLTGCNDKPDVQPVNHQLSVYPNPAVQMANISVRGQVNQAFTLQVFNTKGEVILDKKDNQGQQTYTVNLQGEPVGNYQVILKANNQVVKQKLIKLGE